MKTYRLSVYRQHRLVGNLDCHGSDAQELIARLESVLPAESGWTLSRWVSDQEKRLLESTPDGIKVLASEKLFRPE